MPDLLVLCGDGPQARAIWGKRELGCLIGRNGAVEAKNKREGDGATPLGRWAVKGLYYRADKLGGDLFDAAGSGQQGAAIAAAGGQGAAGGGKIGKAITPALGWCDDPADPLYNKPCEVGYAASHEVMWRDDDAYDIVAVLDYNLEGLKAADGKGLGSAIFLHVWREGADHTEGCVALRKADLLTVLEGDLEGVEVKRLGHY